MYQFTKETIIQDTLDMGFTHAGLADAKTLKARDEVRDMCAVDKCHAYGKNWSCPPGCGTVEECQAEMASYEWGILVQTTMNMDDDFDMETWGEASRRHRELSVELNDELHKRYNNVLALGGAGCHLCAECTYPDSPCRFPNKRMSGMEGYGLLISDVCKDNNIDYYYGKGTITYTGMFLLKDPKQPETEN